MFIFKIGSGDKSIKFWSMENGEVIKELNGHEFTVYSVAFSPCG